MDKIVYAIVVVAVLVMIIVGLSIFAGHGNTTTFNTTVYYYSSVTTINVTNSTQTTVPGSGQGNLVCTPAAGYTCTNVSYISEKNVTLISATIGQSSGQEWSGFGLGYAPRGTTMSGGVPVIPFSTTNASSTGNTGQIMQSGQNVTAFINRGNDQLGISLNGTIWACYVNSGILYVGNGCTTVGGGPSQYVEIATISN